MTDKKDKIKEKIVEILKHSGISFPSSIPIVGATYSTVLSQLSAEQQIELLGELKSALNEGFYELTKIGIQTQEQLARFIALTEKYIESEKIKDEPITIIIPVGGRAGTLYPITIGMPKPLLIIDTKPMIHHVLDDLLSVNIFNKMFILGSQFSRAIESCIEPYSSTSTPPIFRNIDSPVPVALKSISSEIEGPVLLHSCDILIESINWIDVYRNYKKLKEEYAIIGMFLSSFYYPLPIGVIKSDNRKPNLVAQFQEKPDELLGMSAHIGVFMFEPRLISEYANEEDRTLEKDTIPRAMKNGEKFGHYQVGKWHHIQEIRDYYNIQKYYFPKELQD
jgi:NDP-sugar pyrophosphorylase family protein